MKTVAPTVQLLTNDTPLLDVRAPIEFARGALPGAINLPILNDGEREQVGICYKRQGPEAAEALGHKLVSGDIKQQRIEAWTALFHRHPDLHLYCFRGGQRSQIAARWLYEAGIDIPRIEGGYKALRRLLLDVFENLPRIVVIGGKTGVGKTRFLERLPETAFVDLEGHANHRGSAFGKQLTPQPAQINFENSIAIDLTRSGPLVFLEDESRMIGSINLPLPLQDAMKEAPLLVVEDELEARVDRIFDEYIVEAQQQLTELHNDGTAASAALQEKLEAAMNAIRKRLGGERHQRAVGLLADAFDASGIHAEQAHKGWIRLLLEEYYDPMYDYQLEKKASRIIARGNASAMVATAEDMLRQGATA